VRDMTRRALLPWYNAFSFLSTYAEIDQWSPNKGTHVGDNVLDQWLLSRLQTLKARVAEEMESYRLYNVVPKLFDFIEDLTNWYIRLNRQRFWGEDITADKIAAYSTLYTALYELCQVMAPFAPFLAEHVYRQLGALDGGEATPASVHLCDYPEAESQWVRPELEAAVERMQQVVLLGRQKREEVKIGLRMPLRSLTVVHRDPAVLAELERLEPYVLSELNVQRVRYDTDEAAHIEMVARPNFPVLGKRLGDRMKAFAQAIRSLDPEQVAVLADTGAVEIDGETFTDEEIEVRQQPRPGTNTVSNGRIAVDLDTGLDDELVRGGYAREIVNRLQRRRKELGLNVADRIAVCYRGDQALTVAAREHGDYIMRETLALIFEQDDNLQDGVAVTIDSLSLAFTLSVMTGEVET
jgi:isoleucyl-tRNA synthetase